jgi:hypothetical protein
VLIFGGVLSSHLLRPHWTHKDCGGTVLGVGPVFQCNVCGRTGSALGAIIPQVMNKREYFLSHSELEVSLLDREGIISLQHPREEPLNDRPVSWLGHLARRTIRGR